MTTAQQLIDYLKTLPPETEVSVLREDNRSWSTYTEWADLNLEPYGGNVDYFSTGGKHYLFMGER